MDEIKQLLQTIGLPFAYDHFAEGNSPDPPFLIYLYPESHNFGADGIVYFPVDVVHLELYTDTKAPTIEKTVENALTAQGFFFDKSELAIPTEQLYEVLYSFERKG